jgi:hypothetical protein
MKTKRLYFGVLVTISFLMTSVPAVHADDVVQVYGDDSWSNADRRSVGVAGNDMDDAILVGALANVQQAVTQLQPEAHCAGVASALAPNRQPTSLAAIQQGFDRPQQKRLQAEIGVGFTSYKLTGNGTWYQQSFPYKVNTLTGEFSLGAVYNVNQTIKLRAGLEDLGQVTSYAKATASDANYAQCHYNHSLCWPLSTWYGKGEAKEGYLALDVEHKVFGIPMIAEIARTIYRPTWTEQVPDWRPSATATPYSISVSHDPRLQTSHKIGVGVRLNDHLTLMLDQEQIAAEGDQFPAVYQGSTYTLELRDQF